MIKAEYVGSDKRLKGKTALLQEDKVETAEGRLPLPIRLVKAQFDDIALGSYAHGWHTFPKTCFKEIDQNERTSSKTD